MRRQGAATRGQLTGYLWELPPAFACRGSHAPPRSGACRLTARHGGANSAQGTQGAPRKMQRQGAATPGSTHRVSVGCAPSLRLPRQPQTAPLRRLPPALQAPSAERYWSEQVVSFIIRSTEQIYCWKKYGTRYMYLWHRTQYSRRVINRLALSFINARCRPKGAGDVASCLPCPLNASTKQRPHVGPILRKTGQDPRAKCQVQEPAPPA